MLNSEYVLGDRRTRGDCPVEWSGVGCVSRFPLTRFPRNVILSDLVAPWRNGHRNAA